MRGLTPSKKIAAVQQKNVDLWVEQLVYLHEQGVSLLNNVNMIIYWCVINHNNDDLFSSLTLRKVKKAKQKSK